MNIKFIAIPAIALGAGLGLAACGTQPPVRPSPGDIGGGGSTTSAPAKPVAAPVVPQAVSIVQADGYTHVKVLTAAQIRAQDHAPDTIQIADSAVTSGASGVKGGNTESVIIFGGPGGAAQAQVDAGIIAALEQGFGVTGVSVHANGDVLIASGPSSETSPY